MFTSLHYNSFLQDNGEKFKRPNRQLLSIRSQKERNQNDKEHNKEWA